MLVSRTPSLPTEVWSQVISWASRLQLPQLLGVCSMFHDIIIRLLFSAVKIYLIGGELGFQMLNTTEADWVAETARKLMSTSWEILNHIRQSPRFARVVKSCTIVAYVDGLSIFERLTIANTLLFLPNLQVFHWIGNGPPLDDVVAECIPRDLQKLVIQSEYPVNSLNHLKNLTALHLPTPFLFPDDEVAHDSHVYDSSIPMLSEPVFADILENLSPKLTSLRIIAVHLQHVPIRVLISLVELEIHASVGDEEELVGLDTVFRHATSLQSLTLIGLLVPSLFSFLPSSDQQLPYLTSFRLSYEDDFSGSRLETENVERLVGFLQSHLQLRRLYLRLPGIVWVQTSRLLRSIKQMNNLEVLGLHTGRDMYGDPVILQSITDCLSPRLRALHIAINWNGANLFPLLDALAKLTRLTFLHLYGVVVRLPVLLEDLINEGPHLEMVGLNRALWSIDRVGGNIITAKWPRWKIKYCVEEDLLCEDDAWLFKYN